MILIVADTVLRYSEIMIERKLEEENCIWVNHGSQMKLLDTHTHVIHDSVPFGMGSITYHAKKLEDAGLVTVDWNEEPCSWLEFIKNLTFFTRQKHEN